MKTSTWSGMLFTSLFLAIASAQQPGVPADVQSAMDHFNKAALRANMRFLADDLLEGRGTGTRGQEIAAHYVAAQFEAFGLEPGAANSSYFQPVPFREVKIDPAGCEASITRNGKTTRLKWGEGFLSGGNALQTDISVEAPLVFVGFGVVNPGRDYDSYKGVDVKGKIIVILPGLHPVFRPKSAPTSRRDWRRRARPWRMGRSGSSHCGPRSRNSRCPGAACRTR